jgi:hypothetical protein
MHDIRQISDVHGIGYPMGVQFDQVNDQFVEHPSFDHVNKFCVIYLTIEKVNAFSN